MSRSIGSLLRQVSAIAVLAGVALVATGPVLAQGPKPDPAPPRPQPPRAESPGKKPQPPPPPPATSPPPPAATVRVRAVQPPAAPSSVPTSPLQTFRPAVATTPARTVSTPKQAVVTQKPKKVRKPKPRKRSLPSLAGAQVVSVSSGRSALRLGGLALVVLVLGDTVLLVVSTRLLRDA